MGRPNGILTLYCKIKLVNMGGFMFMILMPPQPGGGIAFLVGVGQY